MGNPIQKLNEIVSLVASEELARRTGNTTTQ